MKILKYFAGSLIISFGLLLFLSILIRATGIGLPNEVSRYLLLIWVALAVFILPFAKKIIRV
jgi:hypothetical protein